MFSVIKFNLSNNGINKYLIKIAYKMMSRGYPTYNDMPEADHNLRFYQYAFTKKAESIITQGINIQINEWKQKWLHEKKLKLMNSTIWEDLTKYLEILETKTQSITNCGNRYREYNNKWIYVH
ncbi:hypothetical protein Bca4012_060863 [Brassica carinata]